MSYFHSSFITRNVKGRDSCQKVMVRCQVNSQAILSRKYRLHKVALSIPSINQRPENLWRENPQTNGKKKDKIKHQGLY